MPNAFKDTIPLAHRVAAKIVRPVWKKVAVAILVSVGVLTWIVSVVFIWLTSILSVVGRSIEPPMEAPEDGVAKTHWGNCWIFALQRFAVQDGGLYIRWADNVRFFWIFRIAHCAWIRELPAEGLVIEQLVPVRRSTSMWRPQVFWYEGLIKRTEARHDAIMTPQEKIDSGVVPLDEGPQQ